MRSVTYSMSVSSDGYVTGPDGELDWGFPDEETFRLATDEVRGAGVHLMGRRLYEAMLVWETIDQEPSLAFPTHEFAALWRALPKVVFSTTLTTVRGNARPASGSLVQEIARLRAEPDGGDIAIGGATLAAEAAAADLIDEYRLRIHPVLLGGGTPFFPRHGRRVELDLVENRPVGARVLYQRYRVVR
ncbi:deaminase [Kitasatospora phosalacinea]|uniref:Deaminase n=1 Tax=Kitasatospora phosalacinea TaxID=2065 RepID=A0A9W6Q9I9_9ACTN|nr:dihydrofolate reductase family protein [Kitasatospora phosalacinea]GLW71034.1 deaminase [Kitasatospora phosalacinea]